MCTFAIAGLALSALGTIAQISQNNSAAKEAGRERVREAENQIVASELRADDQRRRTAALTEEALAIFGQNGLTLEGTPTDFAASQAGEFARERFTENVNIANLIDTTNRSSANFGRQARNQNISSLLNFGSDAFSAVQVIRKG